MKVRGKLIASIVVGAAFGASTSMSNQFETPLTFVLNAGWAWLAVMVLAGWIACTVPVAAVAGVLAATSAVLAYYIADSLFSVGPLAESLPEVGYWVLAVLIMGPGFGLVGAFLKARGLPAIAAGLVVPLGATVEMIWLPRWADGHENSNLTIARILVWVSAAIAAGIVVHRSIRKRNAPVNDGFFERDRTGSPPRAARIVAVLSLGSAALAVAAIAMAVVLNPPGDRYAAGLTDAQNSADLVVRATIIKNAVTVRNGQELDIVTISSEALVSHRSDVATLDNPIVVELPRAGASPIAELEAGTRYVLFLDVDSAGQVTLVDPVDSVFQETAAGVLTNQSGLLLPDDLRRSLGFA